MFMTIFLSSTLIEKSGTYRWSYDYYNSDP